MSDQDNEYREPIVPPEPCILLHPAEKAIRDKFVTAYLVNYDSLAATIEIGYPRAHAAKFHLMFMECPYVLSQIKDKEKSKGQETKEEMSKRVIAGLIRESNYFGAGSTQSARVAALAKLATINGMDKQVAVNPLVDEFGNPIDPESGMFVIPGHLTEEEWTLRVAKQQADLIADPIPKDPKDKPSPSFH